MSSDVVQQILNSAGRQPIPTKAEQLHLARLVQQGLAPHATPRQQKAGDRARQRLVAGNARLAINIARKYLKRLPAGCVMGFEDLIQESLIGLDTAARKFDPSRGIAFSTYASWWCMQAANKAIHNQSRTIRLSLAVIDCVRRWRHKPADQTLEAFAEQWNYTPAQVEWMLAQAAMTTTTSLDKTSRASADDATPLVDLIAADAVDPLEHFDHQLAVEQLEAALPTDLALIEQQAVLGTKTVDLARERGVSSSWVNHCIKASKERLAAVAAPYRELVA